VVGVAGCGDGVTSEGGAVGAAGRGGDGGAVVRGAAAGRDGRARATTRGELGLVGVVLTGAGVGLTVIRTGGAGAFASSTRRSGAAVGAEPSDSNAARQRYPEATPATTSVVSRSASVGIRTRISIRPALDSIVADFPMR
jgi:hypothetical protein